MVHYIYSLTKCDVISNTSLLCDQPLHWLYMVLNKNLLFIVINSIS